ncbi:hypothetical protein [Streptomyces bullii]|uniref:Uncharacterized protein n=1 Tax=Streptomyces bullii TaxID=349910 RepID=A0ABW0UKL5_9ACTN
MFRSSVPSAPAAIATTMLMTFASAAAPAPFFAPVDLAFAATRATGPHRSAGRIAGTSPACAIRRCRRTHAHCPAGAGLERG